jgi:hypothetical protein
MGSETNSSVTAANAQQNPAYRASKTLNTPTMTFHPIVILAQATGTKWLSPADQ